MDIDPRTSHLRPLRPVIAVLVPLACSGCDMLGAIFDTHGLRLIVLIVVAIAAVGFLVSRSERR